MKNIIKLFLIFSSSLYSQETRIKIAILDTGIHTGELTQYYCKQGNKDYTYTGLNDTHGHGTNVAGLITEGLDSTKICIQILKIFDYSDRPNWFYSRLKALLNINLDAFKLLNYKRALNDINLNKPTIANFSFGGVDEMKIERDTFQELINAKVHLFFAAGNDGKDLTANCSHFPACYKLNKKYFHVIANKSSSSNHGNVITETIDGNNKCYKNICMSGSSQATAIATHNYLKKLLNEQSH